MKLILEIDIPNTNHNKNKALSVLKDALFEFQSQRGPTARAYVETRYKDSDYYIGERFEEKVQQVQDRCNVAEEIRRAVFRVVI